MKLNPSSKTLNNKFNLFATSISNAMGSVWTCLFAVVLIIFWFGVGFYVDFSKNWELIFSSVTTVITFIMVFIIQNTQNRDTAILNLKLAELIRANNKARNSLINLHRLSEEELNNLETIYNDISDPEE